MIEVAVRATFGDERLVPFASQRRTFAVIKGAITVANAREERMMRAAIAAANDTALHKGVEVTRSIAISRISSKRAYNVLVVPMSTRDAKNGKQPVTAAVFITDPEAHLPLMEESLRNLFSLTKAEIRFAQALVQGGGIRDAADRLGISLNTANPASRESCTRLRRRLRFGSGRIRWK